MITIAMNLPTILADGAPPGGGGLGGLFSNPMIPLIGVFLIFMIFMSNSKRKQEKQRKAQLESMKRGDRVQTIGGILGTIVEVRDGEVVVKVDETNNTKIKFAKSAISRITTEEDKEKEKSEAK